MIRLSLSGIFSSWAYPILIVLAWLLTPAINRPYLYCFLAVLSFIAAVLLFHLFRSFHDTPVSNLKSTTQGYVGIIAKAMPMPGATSAGPMELPPLVWFSSAYTTSNSYFMAEDAFGNTIVDPKDADVITPWHDRQQKWFRGIFPGETIYILGQISSTSFHRTDAQKKSASLGLLSFWKRDQVAMLNRFDKNGDGRIDSQELLLARDAAEQTIESELDYQYAQPASHTVEKPADFRPLIISSIPLETLQKTYHRCCLIHLLAWPFFSVLAVTH